MMAHLDRRYYIALLTAAAMHGSAHQAPQSFQVITEKDVPDRDLGRNRLGSYTSRHMRDAVTEQRTGPRATCGSPLVRRTSAVDLAGHPRHSGGLSNVATILIELGELDGATLGHVAAPHGQEHRTKAPAGSLEHHRPDVALDSLRIIARAQEGEPTPLELKSAPPAARPIARGACRSIPT